MVKKKNKKVLQKGLIIGISALTVGSQVATFVPASVLAADKNKVVSTKASSVSKSQTAKAVEDGKAVDVSNFAEFKAALANREVGEINLTADIEFPTTIAKDARVFRSVVINGHGHTMNQHRQTIDGEGNGANTVTINDLKVVSDKGDGDLAWYGIVVSSVEGYTINLNNVDYNGLQSIFNVNGTVNISGTTTLKSTNGQENIEARNVNFKKDSIVKLSTPGGTGITSTGKSSIIFEEGSDVEFDNNSHPIYAIGANSKVDIQKNAKVKMKSKTTGIYMLGADSQVNVATGATFNIESIDVRGIHLASTGNVIFQPNSKVDIKSKLAPVYLVGLGKFDIMDNAEVNFTTDEYAAHAAVADSEINIHDGAKVNFNSRNGVYVVNGDFNVASNAVVKLATTNEDYASAQIYARNITVDPNATFNVKASRVSDYAIYLKYGNFKLNNTASYDIQAPKSTAQVFYSEGASKLSFANQTLGVWEKANATDKPSLSWDDLTGSTTINAFTSSNNTSDDSNFVTNFQANKYNRIAGENIKAPDLTVDEAADNKTDITGITTPGSTIKAIIGDRTVTGIVADDGKYSIPTGKLAAGTEVKVVAANKNKETTKTVTVADRTAPDAPRVDTVKETDTVVTGSGEKGATVKVKLEDGSVKTETVGEDGTFSVTIPAQAGGKKIVVTLTDKDNNTSSPTTVTVEQVDQTVTINSLTESDNTVTGTAPANAKLRFLVNGTAVNVGTADENGNYSKVIGKHPAGTVVGVQAQNPHTGAYGDVVTTTVTVVATTLTINEMTTDDTTVSGTAPANSKVRILVNGEAVNIAYADENGNYSKVIGKQPVGTEVGAQVQNPNTGAYSDSVTTIVKVAEKALTIKEMTTSDTTVSGTAPANSKVRILVNGEAVNIAYADENGNYSKVIGKQPVGTEVSVQMQNPSTGAYGNPVTTTVKEAEKELTINEMTTDNTVVTGKAPAKAKIRILINDVAVNVAYAEEDGSYSKVIGKQAVGTKVSVQMQNPSNGAYSDPITTTVKAAK
ncbi:Ig-like domain-containing protein [Listeria sp. PSOL-1]|uniref:Ig-like domain-containing protein n=1 Tax=Listeria sp. PSOL-1 TaxID=1844999 RepID=UPI0013D21662|nr:Ig-like domain-containing protein [Listeria sp. PSOL-1]